MHITFKFTEKFDFEDTKTVLSLLLKAYLASIAKPSEFSARLSIALQSPGFINAIPGGIRSQVIRLFTARDLPVLVVGSILEATYYRSDDDDDADDDYDDDDDDDDDDDGCVYSNWRAKLSEETLLILNENLPSLLNRSVAKFARRLDTTSRSVASSNKKREQEELRRAIELLNSKGYTVS